MDANRHIVLVNPEDSKKEYEAFSKEVKKKIEESR